MQVKYGTFAFPANSVMVGFHQRTLLNDGGQPYAEERTLRLDGYLDAEGQAAIQQTVSAMRTALARPYQDLILFKDDGTPSDVALYNAASTTGVVPQAPSFPDSIGGEYATFRHFILEASGEFPAPNTNGILMSFSERLHFSGGGKRRALLEAVKGPPQPQTLREQTIFRATQEGEAVGYLSTPTPPAPLWPAWLVEENPDLAIDTPQRRGRTHTDYRITWRYEFASPTKLVGVPNVWK